MEVEERVDDVRTHSTGRLLVELDALGDGIEQISTLEIPDYMKYQITCTCTRVKAGYMA